jgi:hypothetical protein
LRTLKTLTTLRPQAQIKTIWILTYFKMNSFQVKCIDPNSPPPITTLIIGHANANSFLIHCFNFLTISITLTLENIRPALSYSHTASAVCILLSTIICCPQIINVAKNLRIHYIHDPNSKILRITQPSQLELSHFAIFCLYGLEILTQFKFTSSHTPIMLMPIIYIMPFMISICLKLTRITPNTTIPGKPIGLPTSTENKGTCAPRPRLKSTQKDHPPSPTPTMGGFHF